MSLKKKAEQDKQELTLLISDILHYYYLLHFLDQSELLVWKGFFMPLTQTLPTTAFPNAEEDSSPRET